MSVLKSVLVPFACACALHFMTPNVVHARGTAETEITLQAVGNTLGAFLYNAGDNLSALVEHTLTSTRSTSKMVECRHIWKDNAGNDIGSPVIVYSYCSNSNPTYIFTTADLIAPSTFPSVKLEGSCKFSDPAFGFDEEGFDQKTWTKNP